MMKLHFSDISFSPSFITLEKGAWTEPEEGKVESASTELKIRRQDQETLSLEGHVKAELVSTCGRCNGAMRMELQSSFRYLATTREERVEEREIECLDEDAAMLYLTEPVIDLAEIAREQLILAQPLSSLCNESCLGLCPECGINRNREKCSCAELGSNSPFAVLGSLKKD
jgi:uncharacterized protein